MRHGTISNLFMTRSRNRLLEFQNQALCGINFLQ
jgi:hypothetical protein